MAEPTSLTAGLNLADQSPDAVMDYFASQLFAPMCSPNLKAQERANMMKLFMTLRFMMCWWEHRSIYDLVPQLRKTYSIPKPWGVLEGRGGFCSDNCIQQFNDDNFPWIILPPTKFWS